MAKRSWEEVTLAERGPGTPRKRGQTSMSISRDLLSLSGEAIFMNLGQLQRKQMQTDRLLLQNSRNTKLWSYFPEANPSLSFSVAKFQSYQFTGQSEAAHNARTP